MESPGRYWNRKDCEKNTGFGDEARGKRLIHWLLYPHFPIENNLSDQEIKSIMANLLESTEARKDKIFEYMNGLEGRIKEKDEAQIIA